MYERFGVRFRSPLVLDHVAPVSDEADLEVRFDRVAGAGEVLWRSPPSEPPFCAYASAEGVILEWEHARFCIGDHTVVVDAADHGAALHDLIRAPWTVVLAARGVETLHGSAVVLGGATVGFLGAPGSGKTTLAWRLTRSGHRLVADDLMPFAEGSVTPLAGTPVLRLRPDVAAQAATVGDEDPHGKFIALAETAESPPPLRLLLVLDEAAATIRRVTGAKAVEAVRTNFFSPVLTAPGQVLRRFALASELAGKVPIVVAPARAVGPDDVRRILEEVS